MDENKRQAQRQKVLKSARILLDDWRTMDCSIRDISATGAKIACPNTMNIPDVFRLVTMADNAMRPVKVTWRKERLIGVHFTGEAKTPQSCGSSRRWKYRRSDFHALATAAG